MATAATNRDLGLAPTPPLVLRFRPVIDLTEEQFLAFCAINGDLRIERTAQGEFVIMSPVSTRSGRREGRLFAQLDAWAELDGTGEAFGPSTGFTLPNGAIRSPDASWIPKTRLAQLPAEELEKFAHLCPDFVAEIRSASDNLSTVQEKMEEYIANGAGLGWLIEPYSRRAFVYRPGQPPEELHNPDTLSGDPVLPGFVLRLGPIW